MSAVSAAARARQGSARGAGVEAVWLGPGCADPCGPKVLRSAMGAHVRLAMQAMDWEAIGAECTERGLRVYLGEAGEGQAYSKAAFEEPLALILGGEAAGAGPEAEALANERVHIPMQGELESLNAGAAGAVLLFAIAGQRGEQKAAQ